MTEKTLSTVEELQFDQARELADHPEIINQDTPPALRLLAQALMANLNLTFYPGIVQNLERMGIN